MVAASPHGHPYHALVRALNYIAHEIYAESQATTSLLQNLHSAVIGLVVVALLVSVLGLVAIASYVEAKHMRAEAHLILLMVTPPEMRAAVDKHAHISWDEPRQAWLNGKQPAMTGGPS